MRRSLLRHRRLTALVGAVMVLGMLGMSAHAALPQHHDQGAHATVCVAALGLAGLALFAWKRRRTAVLSLPRLTLAAPWPSVVLFARPPVACSRAGPPGPVVIRC